MYKSIKTYIDLILAFFLLLFLSPIILVISICLAYQQQSIIFVQERQGYMGKVFKIIKFKTMRDMYGKDGNPLGDEERLTSIGKFLRKYHLDELPQLINILKGDMAIIGPRPLLPEYDLYYASDQRKRFMVKPGITGLAQVKGGNSLSWNSKFKFDIYYVENFSLLLDFKIMIMTIFYLLTRKDNGNLLWAMDKFNGQN
jgi:undecaprenyl phosphate N,N'-diacetylbacillosamine 1-phosphate transferase